MAQRPTADYPIDANTTSGTDLSLILNRFQSALESGNSGSSRPAYITAGGLWVKEGDPMELYLYDGTADQLLYDTSNGINVTEGLWTLVDSNDEAGEIQRPSDVLIDGNLTVTGEVVDGDGNPISIIDPAAVDGVVATWDDTAKQWTPDSSLTIDSSGNATFSGSVRFNTLFNPVYWHTDNNFYTEVDAVDGTLDFHTFNGVRFYPTNASQTRPTLEVQGDATFSGKVHANDTRLYLGHDPSGHGWISSQVNDYMDPANDTKAIVFGYQQTADGSAVDKALIHPDLYCYKDIYMGGKLVSTVTSTRKDLIETLSTLRNATKDETTIEGLRDAIGNAVGGLIEKFEAMEAEAKEKLEEAYNETGTQEITPDKGTKDDKPEAGTMDIEE